MAWDPADNETSLNVIYSEYKDEHLVDTAEGSKESGAPGPTTLEEHGGSGELSSIHVSAAEETVCGRTSALGATNIYPTAVHTST